MRPGNRPGLQTMRRAEREAWRSICIKVHSGVTLDQAVKDLRSDSLFWAREVYEHIHRSPPEEDRGAKRHWKGVPRGKGTWPSLTPGTTQKGAHPTPGKAAGKAKGKGRAPKGAGKTKGKSQGTMKPGTWATANTSGTRYCWKFSMGKCGGGCNELHRCPVVKPNGWACDGKHPANACRAS